jgi:excinuclease UvrABC nuclease subunit
VHAVPWPRFAFTQDDVRQCPSAAGTYRFFDADGRLLYVGKSSNLKRRLAAWFRDDAPDAACPRDRGRGATVST